MDSTEPINPVPVDDVDDMDVYDQRVLLDNQVIEKGRSQVVTDEMLRSAGGVIRLTFNEANPAVYPDSEITQEFETRIPIEGFVGAQAIMDYKSDYQKVGSGNWTSMMNYIRTTTNVTFKELEEELGRLRAHKRALPCRPQKKQT